MQERYKHRDISWLDFNYRVLQEAKDKNVPLLERIKFLAIYSSNLDEYFRVRVANHRSLVRAGKAAHKELDYTPSEILEEILSIVNEQQLEFSRIFEREIIPDLKRKPPETKTAREMIAGRFGFLLRARPAAAVRSLLLPRGLLPRRPRSRRPRR